jgi:CBS domain containing-hemolysin-like protein
MPRITEATDLDTLFDILMEREAHIALVQDDYGGTAGLVTMEDVLETLLGTEIVDEHDEAADLRKVARARARQQREIRDNAAVK